MIIAAGRGSRLRNETDEIPKTLVEVMGRPMLEWILEAFESAGLKRKDVVFICGYRADVIKARYPDFTYVTNHDWENNNILLSLLMAREYLARRLRLDLRRHRLRRRGSCKSSSSRAADITLGCDTAWRRRYVGRTQHPETDAEKLRADGARVVELSRTIPSEQADGEFIGVMKLSAQGAATSSRPSSGPSAATAAACFARVAAFRRPI